MKTLTLEKIPRIIKAKKQLEEKLNLKITPKGRDIIIEGKPEDEYLGEQVLEALDMGFPFSHAMQLTEEDFMFEVINIKEHTKKKDLKSVRGRVIGTEGRTLKTLSELSECFLELKDNKVGIIGPAEKIKITQEAIISIIQGAKQSNAYAFLERNQPEPITDLGLKEKKE